MSDFDALHHFSERYTLNKELQLLLQNFLKQEKPSPSKEIDRYIQRYKDLILLIENEIWSEEPDDNLIQQHQQLYQDLEQIISLKGDDDRHKFIIAIPVADRPQHLQSCLDSLLTLCHKFQYGGTVEGRYAKVMVVVADDSKDKTNISQNRAIADLFNDKGIDTLYFGIDEQLQQLDRLSDTERNALQNILGDLDRASFYHKGASIMRNITYLKLRELGENDEKMLFYFIDSDQEFRVKIHSKSGEQDLFAISFFHALDQIFTRQKIDILTGKVVGDPPVSPSVMAGNFLADVVAFLQQMAKASADDSCRFHNNERQKVDDASYHDMADLFGFKPAIESYQYNCTVSGSHNHIACFKEFSNKLNRFFDGEHPTRKTYYEQTDLFSSIVPARTIYTGNYIFRPSALDYFIPFATLKLRMAGPVLGRIIKAEMGDKFVSANLPMLHKRTVDETGQSEFRPGISREAEYIDLSGEFERQFFGDVMLFTMQELTLKGYPQKDLSNITIRESVHLTETIMYHKYQNKQRQIIKKISLLKSIFSDTEMWWNKSCGLEQARENFRQFIANIDHNFGAGAKAYELIGSKENKQRRLREIIDAITDYSEDRSSWETALRK